MTSSSLPGSVPLAPPALIFNTAFQTPGSYQSVLLLSSCQLNHLLFLLLKGLRIHLFFLLHPLSSCRYQFKCGQSSHHNPKMITHTLPWYVYSLILFSLEEMSTSKIAKWFCLLTCWVSKFHLQKIISSRRVGLYVLYTVMSLISRIEPWPPETSKNICWTNKLQYLWTHVFQGI